MLTAALSGPEDGHMVRTILVVDDDAEVRTMLLSVLRGHGCRAVAAANATEAMVVFDSCALDLVVLDVGLGVVDGLDVCRYIRERSEVPILMFTARLSEEDELLAFACGADDFVTKPCSPRILIARAESLMRRGALGRTAADDTGLQRSFGSLVLDQEMRAAWVEGREVHLTRIEFDLLSMLMENPRRVISRRQILSHVWGQWHGDDHLVEVHLSRLRNKITRLGGPRVGEPVPGVGYRLGRRAEAS
jgi:DNA-binding response OmpR family regulator